MTDATTSAIAATADAVASPSADEIAAVDAWWRANNYLTIGQIYLQANPMLREKLASDHIKDATTLL